MRERALPTAVRGPVLFAAFRRFAAICFSVANLSLHRLPLLQLLAETGFVERLAIRFSSSFMVAA
jgi:hypothetical protein